MLPKLTVFFLRTGNASWSQMAEGSLRKHGGERSEVFSDGLHLSEIHAPAARVMEEFGISVSGQGSKSSRNHPGKPAVHHAIVVRAGAESEAPKLFRAARRQYSWPTSDPVAVDGSLEKRLDAFREMRDGIERRILEWLRDPEVGLVGGRT